MNIPKNTGDFLGEDRNHVMRPMHKENERILTIQRRKLEYTYKTCHEGREKLIEEAKLITKEP